jgi:hypothetical protein
MEKALAMAERIGETLLRGITLLMLTLTAVRRHDIEEVRALIPRAAAAAENSGPEVAGLITARAWLAWQDGHPDEVIRLSGQIAELDLTAIGYGDRYQRWIYLFPLIAARLRTSAVEEAVTAARQLLDPTQQLLPDELMDTLNAACGAWDRSDPDAAAQGLTAALDLAHELHYF